MRAKQALLVFSLITLCNALTSCALFLKQMPAEEVPNPEATAVPSTGPSKWPDARSTPGPSPLPTPQQPITGSLRSEALYDSLPGTSPQGAMNLQNKALPQLQPEQGLSPEYNTESYDLIKDNPFLEVVRNPLSTFSIDVDTASYSNIRRFISQQRQLPPPDAVRIEELVNYFPYSYPEPDPGQPFSLHTELATCPWAPKHLLLKIALKGKSLEFSQAPPNNLVFLLDVSGSMEDPQKLPLLKRSLKLVVDQLREQDSLAIVVYAGAAGLVLPPTSGAHKPKILAALENLQAGGATAGAAGIQLAYATAASRFLKAGNNRVVLATDGDFNLGVSSDAELLRLIKSKRQQGIFLSVLGLGMGNYKDSKLEKLADSGNGNYAYIDSLAEARKLLVEQVGATLLTIAKDVKLQLEFNPAKVGAYRLIGYENRLLAAEDFDNDSKDAGELGAGANVTALYELVPAVGKTVSPALKYQNQSLSPQANSGEWLTLQLRYKAPNADNSQLLTKVLNTAPVAWDKASPDFQFAVAVAGFGMWLRESAYLGDWNLDDVYQTASANLGADTAGYRKSFLELLQQTQALAEGRTDEAAR